MNTSSWSQVAGHPRVRALVALVVAALTAAALVAAPTPAEAASNYDNVTQVLVDNFVDAAVEVSAARTPSGTDVVVLATAANFPDGLTASAVAGDVDGPVLFVETDSLPDATAAEIDRLLDAGDTVYVMGGPSAISNAVTDELSDYTVQRVEGPTRLETAIAAADLVGVPSDGTVLLARAFGPDGAGTTSDRTTGWVDAISCGAYAAANEIPIYLTETDRLSDATAAAIEASSATDVIICGGTAAVSTAVSDALRALGLQVDRVEGPTRVETAIDAAQQLFGFTSAGGHDFTVINGYGENFGYGLAAAPLGDPILMVGTSEPTDCNDATQPSRETLCYLGTGTSTTPANLLVMGDETVIRDTVSNAVGEAAGGEETDDPSQFPALPAPDDVDAVDDIDDDGTRATVTWDEVADPNDILLGYNVYVDGEKQGASTPTVAGGVESYVLSGLTAEEEVTVTVTTLDAAERESDPSAGATVTPTDEVPAALGAFDANAGNGEVTLSWERGPADTAEYVLSRSTNATCPGGTYAEVETITDERRTTYVDGDVTNAMTYCYQLVVVDEADQESDPANAGPVTPNVGTPQVSIQYPSTDDTVYYGPDLVVEYTVTDTDTDPEDLKATWQVSYDGGAGPYVDMVNGTNVAVDFVEADDDGKATFVARMCPVNDSTSTNCIRDAVDSNLRLRVNVTDGTTTERAFTPDLDLVRNPPPVEGLAVTDAAGQVNLEWARVPVPSTLVSGYRIERAEVRVQSDDEDAGVEVCDVALQYDDVQGSPVPQPASGATVTFTDPTVDEGDGLSDFVYCYRVYTVRATPALESPSRLGAGNPLETAGVGVTITDPANNGSLDTGTRETISYKLDIPDGQTVSSVSLYYCVDYGRANPLADPACQDSGGFTQITAANGLVGTPSTADGTNSVQWDVPASINQGDTEEGAIEVRTSGGNGRVIGILFV